MFKKKIVVDILLMKWQVLTQVSLLVETLNLSMSLRNIGHFLLCQKKVALNSSNDITSMLAVLLKDIKVALTDSV